MRHIAAGLIVVVLALAAVDARAADSGSNPPCVDVETATAPPASNA